MTYRDRREARAERLREWARKREASAGATLAANEAQPYRHDIAFLTQPGHIPARARMIASDDRAYASLRKAASMTARADSIERAAGAAIYSDDADAPERLAEKLAALEAERARIVAYNAACRKAGKVTADALALLDDAQRADVERLARIGFLRPNGAMPTYATSNLGGQISKARERLAGMTATGPRVMVYLPGGRDVCRRCGEWLRSHTPDAVDGLDILTCPTFELRAAGNE